MNKYITTFTYGMLGLMTVVLKVNVFIAFYFLDIWGHFRISGTKECWFRWSILKDTRPR